MQHLLLHLLPKSVSRMYKSFHRISCIILLQCTQMFHIIAMKPNFEVPMGSAQWPLQAGYPGLSIKNLNDYVSLFSHCLVNIQNYQEIDIIGIKSPVYITRFDVANIAVFCEKILGLLYLSQIRRFFYGKFPPKSQKCSLDYEQLNILYNIKYTDKSTNARWTCSAQFDLFFPEHVDAPQIVSHSQHPFQMLYSSQEKSLFYAPPSDEYLREAWGKLLIR